MNSRLLSIPICAVALLPLGLEGIAIGSRAQDPVECYCQIFIFAHSGTWLWESLDEIPGDCNTLEQGCDQQLAPCKWEGNVWWEPVGCGNPMISWLTEDGSAGSGAGGNFMTVVSQIDCDSHVQITGAGTGCGPARVMFVECLPCQQPGG